MVLTTLKCTLTIMPTSWGLKQKRLDIKTDAYRRGRNSSLFTSWPPLSALITVAESSGWFSRNISPEKEKMQWESQQFTSLIDKNNTQYSTWATKKKRKDYGLNWRRNIHKYVHGMSNFWPQCWWWQKSSWQGKKSPLLLPHKHVEY